MYMALCDDEGREIEGFSRRSMLDLRWVMSAPLAEGDKYSLLNNDRIGFLRFSGERCWTSCVGFSSEADSSLFAVLPMQRGHEVRRGEGIALERGALVIRITSIAPGGRTTPDPDPMRSPSRVVEEN